ncbi:unnamed protein product [Penicillium salamii]|uniref:D-xylose 1-dehydrogenase (NADP(+), D-xylono-1,5-lactone-forming) n=1 Tax=Penicillium salamii TaxID=1612424 RepID=A0A9W4N842_9EURO|nr:unnamed protein product [Penicillium salamii]CAG8099766.1 unnamed protein product [Penicillium salamii]CAG8106588.1 unnamed protein product [Penicillium salamii]CAG8115979.1 unnamed protein product [Penicillium salamii]CAG8286851.1 unnamed protein product [Penicillium salamii]
MSTPTLKWGIIGTGLISSWFVGDLVLPREDKQANHIIQAIGSSSKQKAEDFIQKFAPESTATAYGSYESVYSDPEVDIVYIGTPHAFHKQACLAAIAQGKHVLCEKPFTLNRDEAVEVFDAARKQGVFVMEALWTRFMPLSRQLQKLIHEERIIGDVHRVFCDFGLYFDLENLPDSSRLKNPALGAGSLLDIGIYSLTWGLILLDDGIGENATEPLVFSAQSISEEIDVATSMILHYPQNGRQGILTSSIQTRTDPIFARIEGSKGSITIEGVAASAPSKFTVIPREDDAERKEYTFSHPGYGFYYEADAVAHDIAAGKTEDSIMPWAETLRVLGLMDGVRARR